MNLKNEEIKYIENQIKKIKSVIESEHYNHYKNGEFDDYVEEYPGFTDYWLNYRIRDLYYLIFAYIESREMYQLLNFFKETFQEKIKSTDNDSLLETVTLHPEGAEELKIISDFEKFLDVFKGFDYRIVKEEELKKVSSILKNTHFILENTKCKVNNEADIYKEVKWVLSIYYPSTRNKNKARFIQEFKTYNPDILIPELKIAIEYKYIADIKDNVDNFIDQIKIDSINYVGDHNYENFIAVIYIADAKIATAEQIELSWKSKQFPANWDLVIVDGSSIIS
jgi:hypothetical protein